MSLVDIFSDSDFDKMFFNPYKVKGSLKKKYPKLKMFKTFQGSDDKLIKYVEMVDEFLKKQNNRVWSMIVSNEQTFFEYQTKLLRPVDGDKDKDILQALQIKSKIMDDLNTINERLETYYMKLYGEDDVLLTTIKADKRLTPEFIANL